MRTIKHEGTASCSPINLFRLISSIEYYPKFLSWCKEAKITSKNQNTIQATALIHKYGIKFYCSFAYSIRSKNEITVVLPSGGPFYSVSGYWRFEGSENKTAFSFELQLEYQNSWWMNFFIIPILKTEVKNFVKAFEQRARLMKK